MYRHVGVTPTGLPNETLVELNLKPNEDHVLVLPILIFVPSSPSLGVRICIDWPIISYVCLSRANRFIVTRTHELKTCFESV